MPPNQKKIVTLLYITFKSLNVMAFKYEENYKNCKRLITLDA